jgi:uncharacterized damage-inducible protein DinB
MNYYDVLSKELAVGTEDLWRNVGAMPADKLTWKPAETSRTAQELIEEIVSATVYNTAVLTTKTSADDAWVSVAGKSLKELEQLQRAGVAEFLAAVKEFPESEYTEQITLPWGAMTYFDVMSYNYWNLMYHIGQIAYIQTLYGDKEMH